MESREEDMQEFGLTERDIRPGCRAISVEGELDLAVADQLAAALERAGVDCSEVLIDLENCQFIDSTGIATIVRAGNRLGERGGRIALCAPSDQVLRVFSITGLTQSGIVYSSVEEALDNSDSP